MILSFVVEGLLVPIWVAYLFMLELKEKSPKRIQTT